MHPSRLRILAPFGAALLFVLVLLGAMAGYYHWVAAGLSSYIKNGLTNPYAMNFAIRLLLTEVLPLYGGAALVLWVATWIWGSLPWGLGSTWRQGWLGRHALGLSLLGLFWIHLVLWWQVPTALWVIPGAARLPFWALFGVLTAAILLPLGTWLLRHTGSWSKSIATGGGWVLIWTLVAMAPRMIFKAAPLRPNSQAGTQVLMVGLDGLRPDVAQDEGLADYQGTHFPNAYTHIPATRLCWSVIWGGSPEHYSVGHALPSMDELSGDVRYELLREMKAKGIKARFYIDDGGTIGLAGRNGEFDEVLMPARGWENFVNSNLAVHLPLFAAWLDVFRVFPTTTPWTPLDAGLRSALNHGRGADLVMYHACLIHQPLFLDRTELSQIPHWWTLSPQDYRPYMAWFQAPLDQDDRYDSRRDPFLAYRIRVRSILAAWKPLWNHLQEDPQYANASRIFFSDHGERFYHATPKIQLQGIHGFDLDPWELRVPLIVAAPRTSDVRTAKGSAVSLMELRDVLAQWVQDGTRPGPDGLGHQPFAPVRYHTLNTDFLRPSDIKYREFSAEGIIQNGSMFPDGMWAIKYEKPLSERGKDVSLAEAKEGNLIVYKPIKGGGAHRLEYEGYSLVGEEMVNEAAFQEEKKRVEALYFRPWKPWQIGSNSSTQKN